MSGASLDSPVTEPRRRALDPVLRPRSVAIIGASADPSKRGYQILRALRETGYAGGVHAVNPRGGEILGFPVAASVDELAEAPDLAVLCTPAAAAPDVLEACARRGIPAALVLALGFREAGPAGEALESRVREVAARTGVRIVGPNTSGLLNLTIGLNLIGLRAVPRGRLALVVQSGNIVLEQVARARAERGEGFAYCVGLGNMADVAWHDVIADLVEDDGVRAMLLYAEGFERGRAFVEAAARATREKPIALLKGGRSPAGLHAARSHTGALASGPAVLHAALRAAGVIELERSDEMQAVGTTLARQPAVKEGGVVILSDGGGQATLAADAFHALHAPLATLAPGTSERLRGLLGPAAAVGNPVDVAGATDREPALFADVLRQLVADPGVGAIALVGMFGGYGIRFDASLTEAETAVAVEMAGIARDAGRAFVVHSLYHGADSKPLDALRDADVPVIGSLETACRATAALFERGRILARPPQEPLPEPRRAVSAALEPARREGRTALLEPEARAVAETYGVPLVPARLCDGPEAAAAAAEALAAEAARAGFRAGDPAAGGAGDGAVAVRLVSGTILHRTEAGGVVLRVRGGPSAASAAIAVADSARRYAEARGQEADVRGVMVSPMLPPPAAELIVGARRDAAFGPVLVVGIGGVAVEALADVALRLLPATREDVLAALDELRDAPLLRGPRGRVAADLEAVADLALALGDCLLNEPDLDDIEVNPVFVYADRALAVDVRALRRGEET